MVSTHLYVLRCGDLVKIGITNDINKRMASLQTGNPEPIILEYIEERYNPRKAEFWLHNQFSAHRVGGEWFKDLTVDQIRSKLFMFHNQDPNPNDR